jgi:hypothetical protein
MWDFVGRKDGRTRKRRMLFTVGGAGSTWDIGYQAFIAQWLNQYNGYYRWQGIGYPAQAFPMGDSINKGVAEHEQLLANTNLMPPDMEWCGEYYSEGAIVGVTVYKRMVSGVSPVSWRLPYLKCVVTQGNPAREKGVAYGNDYAGWPKPGPNSRGICTDEERMVNTPKWWYDFAHIHDIYTDTPDDEGGEDMTLIWQIVRDPPQHLIGVSTNTLLGHVMGLLKSPIKEVPGAVLAAMHGMGFVATKPYPTMPHIDYDLGPATQILAEYGERVPIGL